MSIRKFERGLFIEYDRAAEVCEKAERDLLDAEAAVKACREALDLAKRQRITARTRLLHVVGAPDVTPPQPHVPVSAGDRSKS